MTSRPAAPSSRRQSVGDRSPRSRTRRCGGRSEPMPSRLFALGGRSATPQGLGSAFGSRRDDPNRCPQALLRLDAREQSRSRPIAAAAVRGNPHDGEISAHAPGLMSGTDRVRVFTVDDDLGDKIFTAVEHWRPKKCIDRLYVCKPTTRPLRRPARRSPWGSATPGCMTRLGPRGSGAGLADGSRLPVSVGLGFTNQIKFWGIQPPTPSCRAPDQRRRRAVQSCSATIPRSSMVASTAIAELRDAVRIRRTLQCPVDRRMERLN